MSDFDEDEVIVPMRILVWIQYAVKSSPSGRPPMRLARNCNGYAGTRFPARWSLCLGYGTNGHHDVTGVRCDNVPLDHLLPDSAPAWARAAELLGGAP